MTDRQGRICREYDALNRVTKYTDTMGNVLHYEYDAVGNLTKLIYPDNTAVVYAYDGKDRLITTTDASGHITATEYDGGGRVKAKHFANGGTHNILFVSVAIIKKES